MRHIILLVEDDKGRYKMSPWDIPHGGLLTVYNMVEENSVDIKVYESDQPSDNTELESMILTFGDD